MQKTVLFTSLFLMLYCAACAPRQLSKPYDEKKVSYLYSKSVGDAAKPQPWEIKKDLLKISSATPDLVWKAVNGEQYVLVSSWTKDTTYYKNDAQTGTYNTTNYPIWVTAVPELQQLCQQKKFGRKEGLQLRLKQLLGLPPNVEKNYFVEFWVRPQDLFRPCLDSGVSNINCTLDFPDSETDDHKKWINELRLKSYYNSAWDQNYPWTQLGYTYDWHPKNKRHIGLSEFVIGENKEVIVHRIVATDDYCELAKKK
ncbi:MAG: hypothetical protein AAFV95_03005 [Bacteroidota bacterium]